MKILSVPNMRSKSNAASVRNVLGCGKTRAKHGTDASALQDRAQRL
jgi:hypothetical protein